MREKMFAEAIAEAMMGEMSKDPNIFIAGEDVSVGRKLWNVSYSKE